MIIMLFDCNILFGIIIIYLFQKYNVIGDMRLKPQKFKKYDSTYLVFCRQLFGDAKMVMYCCAKNRKTESQFVITTKSYFLIYYVSKKIWYFGTKISVFY